MKLTTIIIILSLMQVSAASFGQKFTFKQDKATYDQIFHEIRKQTGYEGLSITAIFVSAQLLNTFF